MAVISMTDEKEAEIYRSFRRSPMLQPLEFCSLMEGKYKLSRVDGSLLNRIRNEWTAMFVKRQIISSNWDSVPPQCQSVMNDPAVHLSYQLLSLAFANEVAMEKWPYSDLSLKQRHSLSTFIYTAQTDVSTQEVFNCWTQIGVSLTAEDDADSTFVQCAAQLSALYAVIAQGTDPKRWSNNTLTRFKSLVPQIALNASVLCNPPSSGLFSTGKKQPSTVKELDGTVTQDSFTVLSLAPQFSGDQTLNVHAFSMYKWCIQGAREGLHDMQQSEEDSKMLQAVGKYCLRLLEQCERKPISAQDEALTSSIISECMSVLHIVCTVNEEILHSIIQVTKQLLRRTLKDSSKRRSLLSVLEFLMIHGEKASFAVEPLFVEFFKVSASEAYFHPSFAFDVLDCLLRHRQEMSEPVNYFERFFPSLFKILAWHPCSFLHEFADLLCLMVTTKSACEVFHAIVDLPCSAAVLQLHDLSKTGSPESVVYGHCLNALDEVRFGIIFDYFMRFESGKGDTVDFLGSFHAALAPLCRQPRVVAAGQTVPTLLRKFFQKLPLFGSPEVASSLLSGILERAVLLYGPSDYTSSIRRALAESLLALCGSYPDSLVQNQQEIIEFLAVFQNRDSGGDDLYTNLIWLVGEYSGCTNLTPTHTDVILRYHECLEPVAYEVALMAVSAELKKDKNYLKLLMVLIGALAKLAGRCQEIIPRVLLCLNKVVQKFSQSSCDREHVQILLRRASEVISVLKMPNVAVAVLFAEKGNYLDSTSNLAAASFIIERASELAK